MKNISAKHEDLISESVEIVSGPPAIYQLITKKQKIGTLSRVTVGEKDENKPNKTILLVGETGAGKSTLINVLVNYTIGVEFEDEVWFQILEDEKKTAGESQTSDVIVYEIFGFAGETLPFSLTIIDTPGFGDTKGIEHDGIVNQRLFDLFQSEDGVHELHAVGLVMKASENRVSDRLMYIFNSVMSLFGKDLQNSIIALITHSDGKPPLDVLESLQSGKIKFSRNEMNEPVYFLFSNHQKAQRGTTELDIMGSNYSWRFTDSELHRLGNFLKTSKPMALKTTVEVMTKRIRLTACIQNLQEKIQEIEMKQTEIRQTQKAMKEFEEKMKNNENFTFVVDEVYKEKENITGGYWWFLFYNAAVTCSVCEENCHSGCTMARQPSHCKVMSRGNCTVCTNKCPATKHVKENKKYVNKTRKVVKTKEVVKKEYESNKAECENELSVLENLKKDMESLTAEKSRLVDDAYQHVVRLEQIALNVDSVSTYIHLDFLVEKMKEKGDKQKLEILENVKTRIDKETTKSVKYIWGKLKDLTLGHRNKEGLGTEDAEDQKG